MPDSPSHTAARLLGHQLVRALADAPNAGAAMDAVLREVAQALDAPLAVLWTLDDATGLLRWERDWAAGPRTDELRRVSRRLTFATGVGLPGRVAESGAPLWVEDVRRDPDFLRAELAFQAGLPSVVAGPVASAQGVVGVLEFFTESPGPQAARKADDVGMAGAQLGAYLARVRVEERLRASEEWSQGIVGAALDCIITMDHEGRVLDFNPAAQSTFGYHRDEAVGRMLAELIIPEEYREPHQQALERYLETREGRILNRRLELTGLRADGSQLPVELTVTRLGTEEPPLFAGFIRDISERRAFETEQSRLLQDALVARAQADASRLRTEAASQETERARARLALLARAGREMARSMDWESTLQAVVRTVVPAVADGATLTVAERGDVLRVVAMAHADPERERLAREVGDSRPPDASAERGVANVIRTGELEIATDLDSVADPLLNAMQARHVVIAPLRTHAGVIGALSFVLGPSGRSFQEEDLELVTALAGRASLHIQNARLYTERSHIAETLQASLRPRPLPEVAGADIAARFLPAGDHNEVGGDFYELFRSGDGIWTAIVGDVAGKGPEAAAVTALARYALRTASMVFDDPAKNLALLNRAMVAESPAADFCTVLYVRLCPNRDGIGIRFANAGHPAPLVLRPDGSVRTVEGGRGPLVGATEDSIFQEGELHLDVGDLLVMYTDGVTEIRTSDVDLGERELRATLAASAGATAAEVVEAIEHRAVELQDGAPRDDIALVAIRAVGLP